MGVQNLSVLIKTWFTWILQGFKESLIWLKNRPLYFLYCFAVLVAIFGTAFLVNTQLPMAARVVTSETDHLIDQPIVIDFEQNVNQDFVATISPKAKGEFKGVQSLFGVGKVEFIPQTNGLSPDTTYAITITNLKRVTGQALPDVAFIISTEKSPAIVSLLPQDQSGDNPVNSEIVLTLQRPNRNLRKLKATIDAAVSLTETTEKDGAVYRWRPAQPLKQGQTYQVKIYDDFSLNPGEPVMITTFSIVPEPKITAATTNDHFYPGQTIDVEFDVPMTQESPALLCECSGDGNWVSDKHYKFTPSGIEVNKTYPYKVPAGLKSLAGGVVEADKNYQIKTPGHVVVSFGGLGSNAATNSRITVNFDQAVDKASAEQRFSISPGVGGSFSWPSATTMVFSPNSLEQQTGYVTSIASGVKPIEFGLDSNVAFSMSFRTAAPTVKLNVPLYRQQYSSSCEAAALRMALAYRGIYDSDMGIVQRMGYNGQRMNRESGYWDDPFQMYVGDVTGRQSLYQGYGAYAPPIAKAAQSYGRNAAAFYGVDARFVAQQIHDGHPVVIIGTVGGMAPQYTSWNGPNGLVHAWIGEHARTVIGVTGKASDPISFIVNDPNTGTQQTWSPGRLIADINAITQLPSQVVVVY